MTSHDSCLFARASRVFAVGGVFVLLAVLFLYAYGVRINRTNSLPKGLYRVVKKTPERGDIVTFWPSDCAEMRLARSRGYIFEGVFNNASGVGYGLLMKRLLGVSGDMVSVTDAGIVINGSLLPNTRPLLCDSIGAPLPYLRFTGYALKEHEAFFVSDHMPRSYDARYFGVQEMRQIVDVLVPVYVW